jgi:hypothetical protein
MRKGNKLRLVLAMIVALALAIPGAALASNRQEMVLQDDSQLIYATPAHAALTLQLLKSMGVDRVRVSVVWSLLAPASLSTHRPQFNATDPAAYPAGVWTRYDFLDREANKVGINLYFQPTAPAPYWATTPLKVPQGYRYTNNPNAKQFGEFVQAVAKRYSGRYSAPDPAGGATRLPAISYWGIWNEPNIGGWMTPQWSTLKNGTKVEASPAIYRGMVDAAWSALARTGHRHDTILIGETAAYGAGHKGYGASMDPLTFLRAFYCVGTSYKPLKGKRATELQCPKSGSRGAFARAHPALFQASGWAHHPYDFIHPPTFQRPDANSATLANLSRIETALDRSHRAYHKAAGMPIYITEWGVQSDPPNPFQKFSTAQQAAYINEGEYMAWKNPRVKAFAQFLLVDDAPNSQHPKGSRAYWSTFDSGLFFYEGTAAASPKPAYFAFQLPLWLPKAKHGGDVAVWAQIRPSDGAAGRTGTLQFQAAGASIWTPVTQVNSANPEGFISTHVALSSAGALRLAWADAQGQLQYSRTAQVS